MNAARPWEHGSEFHWPDFKPESCIAQNPWNKSTAAFFGSGRDAFRALLAQGAQQYGWKRVWIPSFFCQEVVAAMRPCGPKLLTYADAPGEQPGWPEDLDKTDAVLVVNYFGLRAGIEATPIQASGAALIEDHTHDPWSPWASTSSADFCILALRKTLPVPDGGVLWSPRGHILPAEPPVTDLRQLAADAKRAAMFLKSLFLAGHPVSKDAYRALFFKGEAQIADGAVSGITAATRAILDCFPISAWRKQRRKNGDALATALAGVPNVRLFKPDDGDVVPFSTVLVLDTHELRESVRAGLIARRIYPAVLWSLDIPALGADLPAAHVDLSRRVLSLHCDARYGPTDMKRVAEAVVACLG